MTSTNCISGDSVLQLDIDEILARIDGDCQLLADLCELSLTELPRMNQTLVDAVGKQDADAVHRAAHRLKGALSVFGDGPHIRDCLTLEEMGRKHDISSTPEMMGGLEMHLDQFSAAVAALGKECHARADRR